MTALKLLQISHRTIIISPMEINRLKVPQWETYPGLLHGFIGRRGGKSVGRYAGLNLSYRVDDDPKIVSQNVCDMKLAVGIHDGRIVTMKQVHGDNIVEVKDKSLKEVGEADGMITGELGVNLGVLTADCVPILFVAPKKRLAAAVHAGWRGTLAGIAERTVRLFADQYGVPAGDLEVALGPSIGPCCYEVKDDVAEPLMKKWGKLTTPSVLVKQGKTFVNLSRLNRDILRAAGVPGNQLFQIGPCTSCATEDFFSYRRAGGQTGRQISVVGWLRQ
ncbi:MAG TPA: peptidoglycan editing factor PgeF [Verrucomicrobiae bacterium]|nr:peptidoglycan editing factor PgeF [Verrucomicrobiae bacterium]